MRPISPTTPSAPLKSRPARSSGIAPLLAHRRDRLLAWRQTPVAPRYLSQEQQRRQWQVVDQVAPPEPRRLADEPVRPLQPQPLHPQRRATRLPGEEVERAADADAHRN